MKQPKKLIREHKEWLKKKGYDPTEWMLLYEDTKCWIYIHKTKGTKITREKTK